MAGSSTAVRGCCTRYTTAPPTSENLKSAIYRWKTVAKHDKRNESAATAHCSVTEQLWPAEDYITAPDTRALTCTYAFSNVWRQVRV